VLTTNQPTGKKYQDIILRIFEKRKPIK